MDMPRRVITFPRDEHVATAPQLLNVATYGNASQPEDR
jgi:hypothetical protein